MMTNDDPIDNVATLPTREHVDICFEEKETTENTLPEIGNVVTEPNAPTTGAFDSDNKVDSSVNELRKCTTRNIGKNYIFVSLHMSILLGVRVYECMCTFAIVFMCTCVFFNNYL